MAVYVFANFVGKGHGMTNEDLASANKAKFDALFLWHQRDAAFLQLARANVPILDSESVLKQAHDIVDAQIKSWVN